MTADPQFQDKLERSNPTIPKMVRTALSPGGLSAGLREAIERYMAEEEDKKATRQQENKEIRKRKKTADYRSLRKGRRRRGF